MKYIIILLLISSAASAQTYSDSSITIKGTQLLAIWVTKGIQINAENRKLPDVLKPYVANGEKLDSTFTVTLKAGVLKNGIELLLTCPMLVGYNDYRKIILNTPSATGYTGLATQITSLANGNGAQKATAQWLLDWYSWRVKSMQDKYDEEKSDVIKLVQ